MFSEGANGNGSKKQPVETLVPAESNLELELKLAGCAKTLESLWTTAIAKRDGAKTRHLISTYFDTSDLRLRRRGFTLRVRQDGRKFVQTVKAEADGSQGVMQRGEWSVPVPGPAPDLMKLDAPDIREKIGLLVAGELQPVFTTDVVRETKTYRVRGASGGKGAPSGGARIEAALDRGEIRCNGRSEEICEIELELLGGSLVALQKQAVKYLDGRPLYYQPLSKSARGFALALGERPRSRKAVLPRLGKKCSVDRGLERVMTSCVNHWLANHAAVLDGSDIEGVHQMRVALRRMRSAVTLLRSALPEEDRVWLNTEAKFLIGDLGGARDWDVFIAELLTPVLEARPGDPNLDVLTDAVEEERRQAYERARATLRSSRYLKFVLELGAWLDGRAWRHKETRANLERRLIDLADEVLTKRHKQSMKLGRKFESLPDEDLHRLRISLKKLRYATEFFGDLYGKKRTGDYLTSLRRLQDDLGHLNDVAVAEARLSELYGRYGDNKVGALQVASGTVIGWYSHALEQIRPKIAEDWHSFSRVQPFWEKHRREA